MRGTPWTNDSLAFEHLMCWSILLIMLVGGLLTTSVACIHIGPPIATWNLAGIARYTPWENSPECTDSHGKISSVSTDSSHFSMGRRDKPRAVWGCMGAGLVTMVSAAEPKGA